MIARLEDQRGFSAAELLIALFIGAAFILTSYQLYSIVVQDGSDSRTQAVASNVAYEQLRFYSPQTTNPCSNVTVSPTPTIPDSARLSHASIAVAISCPYGTTSGISKVQVTVTYGIPATEVVHAIFTQ